MKKVLLLAVCLFSFQAHAAMHAPADVNEAVVTLMQDKAFVEKCLTLYQNGAAPEEIIEQLSEEKKAHGNALVLGSLVVVSVLSIFLWCNPALATSLYEGTSSLCSWFFDNAVPEVDDDAAQSCSDIVTQVCNTANTCYEYFNECAFEYGPTKLVEIAQDGMRESASNLTICPVNPFAQVIDVCRQVSGTWLPDRDCFAQFCPESMNIATCVATSENSYSQYEYL
ncbi:hypothetical protein K2W90_01190 [Candidatus Babeliales bacterium]|nr:hypothetical protein [Candidatus Babeliales bacterium]